MKLLFEIYRILRELGIKTKDIIGVGKTIQKTGTKLFKENIDPKILEVIYDKGTLSDKIKKIITEAAKNLRNTKFYLYFKNYEAFFFAIFSSPE